MASSLRSSSSRSLTRVQAKAIGSSRRTVLRWLGILQSFRRFLREPSTKCFAAITVGIPANQDGGQQRGHPWRVCALTVLERLQRGRTQVRRSEERRVGEE